MSHIQSFLLIFYVISANFIGDLIVDELILSFQTLQKTRALAAFKKRSYKSKKCNYNL